MLRKLALAILVVASCGGGGMSGVGRDAGQGGGDGGGHQDGGDAAQCPPPAGSLATEPAPRQVAFDGGVPIDQVVYALAIARCDYVSRCYALSTYVANQCIDSLVNLGSWPYQTCGTNVVGSFCSWTGLFYDFPSARLVQAVTAGTVHYDAQQEAQCLAALSAEGCAGEMLLENIPACAGVFTCAADAGSTAGAAADAGAACAQLLPPNSQTLHTCTTDQDCAGVTGNQQGPNCVDGICAPSRCGITVSGCTSFVAAGQACNTNAISPLNSSAPGGPAFPCSPGLACQGQLADGGLGTCVLPLDVGETCTDDTGCKPGLVCECGACEIPPSAGACVHGACQIGVAYCDPAANVCRPVRPSGASCADAFNSCGPGLVCQGPLCAPFK